MTTAIEPVHVTREVPGVGTIEFTESPTRRDYWFKAEDGQRRSRLQSVTTIIKGAWPTSPELLAYIARQGEDTTARDDAAERGRNAHAFIEHYLMTGDLLSLGDFPEGHRPYMTAAARFLWDFAPEAEAVEQLVAHPELRYAGRMDLRADLTGDAQLRGQSLVVDFKTSPAARIYSTAHVQASAYAIADERCGAAPADGTLLVALGGDGTYRCVPGEHEAAVKLWKLALRFYGERRAFEKVVGA